MGIGDKDKKKPEVEVIDLKSMGGSGNVCLVTIGDRQIIRPCEGLNGGFIHIPDQGEFDPKWY